MGLALLCAALLVSGVETRARAQDAPAEPASKTTSASGKPASKKTTKKTTTKKKKKTARAPADATTDANGPASKRRKIGASPAYVVGDSDAHLINQNAPPIVPFPEDSKAVKKAFAETRRDQLVDAEKAARDEKSPDRWRTVLFMLRGLNERIDPEACFWRVLSFYRLGEVTRARKVREGCDLLAKDSVVLNAEDATAAGIPEMGATGFEDTAPPGAAAPTGAAASDKDATKPAAPAATPGVPRYTGPGPQHYQ